MSGCEVVLDTTSGKWLCNRPAKARGMCNAHLLQESAGKPMTIPRGWSTTMGVSIGGRKEESMEHINAVDEYISGVTWLKDNDPVIVALRSAARELDNHYSNATLNQYRLLLKDIRDSKPKDVEATNEERHNKMLLALA